MPAAQEGSWRWATTRFAWRAAGRLLAVLDQTREELTKRSHVLTDTRGFERLQVVVATLNRNDRPGIAPGRQLIAPGLLHPRGDVARAIQHAPNVDMVRGFDVEHDVREAPDRPRA